MREYIIIDVETCPVSLDSYFELDEEEKLKKLNPIDSKIVAAGIRHQGKNIVFQGENEKEILDEFWLTLSSIRKGNVSIPLVGFNIADFDMYMLVARSLINKVTIMPFKLKELVDLRQKIFAYKFHARGKMKEIAELAGFEIPETDGSKVAEFVKNNQFDKIEKYLEADLEVTDNLFKLSSELNITQIDRW